MPVMDRSPPEVVAADQVWSIEQHAIVLAGLAVFAVRPVSSGAPALGPTHHASFVIWLVAVGILARRRIPVLVGAFSHD